MNDPEKAKYLEENLAALPDCASYAVSHAQGTLTSISYEIDANGNITGISSGTNDPDGKIARENAERRAKEKKAAEEKAAERRKKRQRNGGQKEKRGWKVRSRCLPLARM
jgi:ATPase subunit of ABC transporter with duplicated ATPase domains